MTNREELENKLKNICNNPHLLNRDGLIDCLIDFIEKDRQIILKPLIEHKKTWTEDQWGFVKFKDAINEAINLAGLEEK